MKEKHIVYSVIAGYVQLFLTHKLQYTGYVFDSDPNIPDSMLIGLITVYDNPDHREGERTYFYLVSGDMESSLFGTVTARGMVRGKTGFPIDSVPVDEMGMVQKEVIYNVLHSCHFNGELIFWDKKRVVLISNGINCCTPEELLV